MKRTVLSIILLITALGGALAAPARPGVITKKLPDGSTINLMIHGDEYYSYVTTEDGYLVKEMPDGFYEYAKMLGGVVTPMGIRAVDAKMRTAEAKAMLRGVGRFKMSDKEFAARRRLSPLMASAQMQRPMQRAEEEEDTKAQTELVLLVDFKDVKLKHPLLDFYTLLDGDTAKLKKYTSEGFHFDSSMISKMDSILDSTALFYFLENSYCKYIPAFEIIGPITLDNTLEYYGAQTATAHDTLPAQMVLDAVRRLSMVTNTDTVDELLDTVVYYKDTICDFRDSVIPEYRDSVIGFRDSLYGLQDSLYTVLDSIYGVKDSDIYRRVDSICVRWNDSIPGYSPIFNPLDTVLPMYSHLIDSLDGRIVALDSQIVVYDSLIIGIDSIIDTLSVKITMENSKIVYYNDTIRRLNGEIRSLKSEINELNTQIDNLPDTVQQGVRDSLTTERDNKKSVRETHYETRKVFYEQRDSVYDVRDSLYEDKRSMCLSRDMNDSVKASIYSAKDTVYMVKDTVYGAKDTVCKERIRILVRIPMLENDSNLLELNDHIDDLDSIGKARKEIQDTIREVRDTIASVQFKLDSIQNEVDSIYNVLDSAYDVLYELKQTVDSLTGTLDESVKEVLESFTLSEFDRDGDGFIDNVSVITAGPAECNGAPGYTVWPHHGTVTVDNTDADSVGDMTFNGVTLRDYMCATELAGADTTDTAMAGIGIFCHEFSHSLGLQDMYVTQGEERKTLGKWDVMDIGCHNNDGETPAGMSAFERFYLGWSEPVLLKYPVTKKVNPTMGVSALIAPPDCYVITDSGRFDGTVRNAESYYLVENRQQYLWDEYVPGHGLLIERITWNEDKWNSNICNNTEGSEVVKLMQAGTSRDIEGDSSDTYPGSDSVRVFTKAKLYPITNIKEKYGQVTFDFKGGDPVLYTVYFEGGEYGRVPDSLKSITQLDTGYTIVLPAATPDEGYDFKGWSTDIRAKRADAGDSGTVYKPTYNHILYAVYSLNGSVEPIDVDTCFIEEFTNLKKYGAGTIVDNLDSVADNKGWLKGSECYLQVGDSMINVIAATDSSKAVIMTPPTGLMGDLVVMVVASHTSMAYLGVYSSDEQSADYQLLDKGIHWLFFYLEDVEPSSPLVISSDLNQFGIKAIYVCGEKDPKAGSEYVAGEGEARLIRSDVIGGMARVVNVQPGSTVRVIDVTGRVLSSEEVGADVYEFNAPECFYLVQVMYDGRVQTLK